MKNIIFILLFTLSITALQAQSVNDIPIKDIEVEYMQIVGTSRFLSNKVTIQIDFGQENKFMSYKNIVKDASGKAVIFNSMIDALNFMSQNGYGFVTAYVLTVGNQNVYHYLGSAE